MLVSAFITEGLCWKILLKANRKIFSLFTTPFILKEFKDKLSGKFGFSAAEADKAANLILEVAQIVDPDKKDIKVKGVCRDADDNAILAAALASKADYLVTGDADILILKTFKGINILSPKDFELLLVSLE